MICYKDGKVEELNTEQCVTEKKCIDQCIFHDKLGILTSWCYMRASFDDYCLCFVEKVNDGS